MYLISETNALTTLQQTGFRTGIVTGLNRTADTADVTSQGSFFSSVPVFYNLPCAGEPASNGSISGCSDAFAIGDEVVIRFQSGVPSHIIGFKDSLWPCVATPAFLFSSENGDQLLNTRANRLDPVTDSRFYTRYIPVDMAYADAEIITYINDPDADTSTGFVSYQTHWTDARYNRETQFLCNGELVYSTYNNETFAGVFNGTRSNVFGAYIHPQTGWGAAFYQINTLYDWLPHSSGRVVFDYYFFSTQSGSVKLASAECNVTGSISDADGAAVTAVDIRQGADAYQGGIFAGSCTLCEAVTFSSDGSTNLLETGETTEFYTVNISDTTAELTPLPEQVAVSSFDIYIKNR